MDVEKQIAERKARVSVIGLGYVGLPLAVHAAEAGFTVTGIDSNPEKVRAIASGTTNLGGLSVERLETVLGSGRFAVTGEPDSLTDAAVIVICVPTPLKDDLPDMTHVEAAADMVARHLSPGTLVILESTTYPGTTEELLKPRLEEGGRVAGRDFFLGFSPERIEPGNEDYGVENIPKVIGGIDEASTDLMDSFYGAFVKSTVRVTSPRTAEMTKLLENTYRHVNIALINEVAILCHDLGIDVWEVIDAASTKPFGFQPFYPGPGWGGHCIPVDPTYLSWRVRQLGATARFVELAREFNKAMPGYVVQRMGELLNESGKSLKNAKVLVLGVTYKPNVADMRESPAIAIIEKLLKSGALVSFHDPFVDSIDVGRVDLERADLDKGLSDADLVLVHTAHSTYDWARIAAGSKAVFDTRNAMRDVPGPNIVRL